MSEIKYVTQNQFYNGDIVQGFSRDVTPAIPQGTGKKQRIGNVVQYKFLQMRGGFCFVPGTAVNPQTWAFVRVVLVQERQDYPGAPPANINALDWIWDENNPFTSIRNTNVRVIMDKTYKVSTLGNYSNVGESCLVFFKKKVRINNRVTFMYDNLTLPRDTKDKYRLLIFPDNTNAANNITLRGTVCLRYSFIDI